ncbi:hypothetical protein COCMIDRAFT_3135 [Bipolaris oryzae ATCC 44560]|uniref:INO80 complex subunit F domain-containing protein n=1 Tax=Bipolaris oryzae ATCC 44560 TaxID=930090 RepID=W6ZDP0_COCMI|nr:uncharacterized protein COCMIDRAFT_3135 [Bipolaris oryzae ATCC 44560]EUC48003.1 hypothetical protein COCMIDRAFT_3135 [Bipolaris oryzae ATCC 44560]
MPQPPSRAIASKDLPPSVETAYYRKCIDLRRRITDIEDNNDGTRLRITRLNRGIQKMRLERAFLLEQLNKHMEYNVDDSDRSSSPPPTPTDKPLRSKRSHNRKGTPPLGSSSGGAGGASSTAGGEGERLGPEGRIGAIGHISHSMNPVSSAQSTPDPGRSQSNYFSTVGAGSATTAASPPASVVNGAPPPSLPPLHSLPSLQPQQPAQSQSQPQRQYFDPTYDEQRTASAANDEEGGRRRALSGAAQQPPNAATTTDSAAAPAPPQNGDTEMTDASFTAVNR